MQKWYERVKPGSLTTVLSHLLDFVPPPLMQWPFGHLAICLAKFQLCLQGYLCGWRFGKLFVHHGHRSRRDGMNDSESSGKLSRNLPANQPTGSYVYTTVKRKFLIVLWLVTVVSVSGESGQRLNRDDDRWNEYIKEKQEKGNCNLFLSWFKPFWIDSVVRSIISRQPKWYQLNTTGIDDTVLPIHVALKNWQLDGQVAFELYHKCQESIVGLKGMIETGKRKKSQASSVSKS